MNLSPEVIALILSHHPVLLLTFALSVLALAAVSWYKDTKEAATQAEGKDPKQLRLKQWLILGKALLMAALGTTLLYAVHRIVLTMAETKEGLTNWASNSSQIMTAGLTLTLFIAAGAGLWEVKKGKTQPEAEEGPEATSLRALQSGFISLVVVGLLLTQQSVLPPISEAIASSTSPVRQQGFMGGFIIWFLIHSVTSFWTGTSLRSENALLPAWIPLSTAFFLLTLHLVCWWSISTVQPLALLPFSLMAALNIYWAYHRVRQHHKGIQLAGQ